MARWSHSIVRRCGAIGCAALIGSGLASAQTQPGAPAGAPKAKPAAPGVFGGAASRSGEPTSGLLVTLTEAYDENVLADAGPIQSSLQAGGLFTDLTANFTARVQGRKLQFSSAAGTDVRYYSQQHTTVGIGHYGSSGLTYTSGGTTFSIDGGVAYAPSYLYRLFASVAAVQPLGDTVAAGYAIADTSSLNYDARISLTQSLSPRNRITVRGSGRYSDFLHNDASNTGYGMRDLASYDTSALFGRAVTRNVNLNVGYTYRRAQYYTGQFPTEHDVTFGLDYDRPISKTRRTHLRVGASTIMLDAPAPGDGTGILRRQYKTAADASLSRQFARSWQASGAYRRGVGFIEGFTTPVLTDGFSVNTTGLFSRRVDFLGSASYSVGEPVVAGESSGFTTYAGDVRMRVALNNRWALYGEYLYYYYDFGRGFVPAGVPQRVSRNSVRAGLTMWMPMGGR
jgi:hypothetical protein